MPVSTCTLSICFANFALFPMLCQLTTRDCLICSCPTTYSWPIPHLTLLHFLVEGSKAIDTMVKFKRDECLAHPVVEKFIELKWNSATMKKFYYTNLLVYSIFLICLTTHIVMQANGKYRYVFVLTPINMHLCRRYTIC